MQLNKSKIQEEQVTRETKNAWTQNWESLEVVEVLEIFEYTRVKRLLEIFRSILPREGKILEGGCGLGPWVIKLSELDYDSVSINKIREYAPKIHLEACNVEDMPFDDETFDAYMSLGVLEHFCDGPGKAIREANRILKTGGIFLVMLPYLNILERIKLPLKKMKKSDLLRRVLGKPRKTFYYECYFGLKEISDLLEFGGFKVENIRPVDHIFTFVSFSGVFRDKGTYDGENEMAVKVADSLSGILPWQTAGSSLIVARKNSER